MNDRTSLHAGPEREGRGAKFWAMMVLLAFTIVFILLNSQQVEIKFIFGTTTAPLVFALAIAAGLGFLIGLLLPRFRGGGKD